MGEKRGFGPVVHGGREMPFGKGAVAGGFAFLSGAEGRHPDTGVPVEGIGAQTEVAFAKIKSRLEEAGGSIADIVKLTAYLKDRGDKDAYMAARDEWLEQNSPEVLSDRAYGSTLLFVSGMSHEDMLIEIDCIAYIGE
jgi:enamine deaminase RidA (YjgF/YER057c/UK114 family)